MKQLTLTETPAMLQGRSFLHMCRNCGAILYVTSKSDKSTREWDSPCPVCKRDDWVELKRGQGPFEWT